MISLPSIKHCPWLKVKGNIVLFSPPFQGLRQKELGRPVQRASFSFFPPLDKRQREEVKMPKPVSPKCLQR